MSKLKEKSSLLMQYTLIAFCCLVIVLPIMILLVASFKSNIEFANTSVLQFAETLNFDNYLTVLKRGKFFLALKNTCLILLFSVLINVMIGTMLSYALSRLQFRLKRLIIFLILAARVIPTITTQVATFKIVQGLGFYDTLAAPILLYASSDVIQVFLYLRFIESIPYSIDESAIIDGASHYRICWSVIFPLMKPAIVTSVILRAVHIYNDMYIPYLYLPSSTHRVVSTAIMSFCGSNQGAQIPLLAAAFIIVMLPMVILYLFSQRLIFDGLTTGAVKE